MVPEFAEIYALPCPEVQPPIADGDCQGDADERRLYVRWHVVCPLVRVQIQAAALRSYPVKGVREVGANVGVEVLVDAQCATCVKDEQVQQSLLRKLPYVGENLIRNQVATPGAGLQRELVLCYHDGVPFVY